MRSSKKQSNASAKCSGNSMEQQAFPRQSKRERTKDPCDNLPDSNISRERSRQNLTSSEQYRQKMNEPEGEFNDSFLEAIQKSIDHTLRAYFLHTIEKFECLSGQVLRNEYAFSKMHLDLVERICKLCKQTSAQYQNLLERIDSRLSNPSSEDPYEKASSCSGNNSECDDPIPGEQQSPPMRCDDSSMEVQQPLSQKVSHSNTAPCCPCEDKLRSLNLELKFTKEELEQCLKRLKEIKDLEQTSIQNSTVMSDKQKLCTKKQSGSEETSGTSQSIPQPPPQPLSQQRSISQQKSQRRSERKSDYDSKNAGFIKSRSSNHSNEKSSPDRTQNFASQQTEKKTNHKGR